MTEQLSTLLSLNPREVWPNEATDFTPWLQQNIDLLAAAVGVDIQLVKREVDVGDFSADLVGEEPGSGKPVIIENQLERTNHDHLGKLMTYAAGKDARVVIWVAPEIRPEHRDALAWLNQATEGNISFFGVEVELLQIEGSPLRAPNFRAVVVPKTVSLPPPDGSPSEREKLYQSFFQDILLRIKTERPGITNASKVGLRSWLSTSSGKGGFSFGFAFTSDSRFRIELYIDTGDGERNKQAFDQIYRSRESVQEQLQSKLAWERLDKRRACRVAWYWDKQITIMHSTERLRELQAWAVDSYFKFRDELSRYLEDLPSNHTGGDIGALNGADTDTGA